MDPNDASYLQVIESPRYPKNYPNNAECKWTITAAEGAKITIVLDDFNVEWNANCDENDYLFVGRLQTYTKVYLCGSVIPANFSLTSKKSSMVLKFVSNGTTRKSGFRAILTAA